MLCLVPWKSKSWGRRHRTIWNGKRDLSKCFLIHTQRELMKRDLLLYWKDGIQVFMVMFNPYLIFFFAFSCRILKLSLPASLRSKLWMTCSLLAVPSSCWEHLIMGAQEKLVLNNLKQFPKDFSKSQEWLVGETVTAPTKQPT